MDLTSYKEWHELVKSYNLNDQQQEQFQRYAQLLITHSELINLTTITKPTDIISYHFDDSLCVTHSLDFSTMPGVVDVGTGAGFPGIPLKILYPQLPIILIEVNNKKINFLREVIQELNLTSIELYELDWRTFLRKTNYAVSLFVSRASLHVDELLRIFKPSSPYKHAQLVYWASKNWIPVPSEEPYIIRSVHYKIKNKDRRLIFFGLPDTTKI